jgi:hypothetical protein
VVNLQANGKATPELSTQPRGRTLVTDVKLHELKKSPLSTILRKVATFICSLSLSSGKKPLGPTELGPDGAVRGTLTDAKRKVPKDPKGN